MHLLCIGVNELFQFHLIIFFAGISALLQLKTRHVCGFVYPVMHFVALGGMELKLGKKILGNSLRVMLNFLK